MLEITLDDAAFRQDLQRLYARLGDFTPVMQSLGAEFESRISKRFEARRDPNGAAWAPWAASTRASYPKNGNRKILDRYSTMLSSLSHQADKSSVRIGFVQPYSSYHEFSTKKMPRRGLIYGDADAGTLAKSDEEALVQMLTDWINGSFD